MRDRCAVRVDCATDRCQVAGLELVITEPIFVTRGFDDFAGHAGIDGGHYAAPLVAGLVKVAVANAAKENLNLDVRLSGIAARNGGSG